MRDIKIDFNKKYVHILMIGMLLLCSYMMGMSLKSIVVNYKDNGGLLVAIDVGHGGNDPGKVVGEILEKDINLEIALMLREELLERNIRVVITREDDSALYDENAKNKKTSDMKNRCQIINSSDADIMISIHQNSYESPSVKGAQVFYCKGSEEGKELAYNIQTSIRELVDNENTRSEKSSDGYYLLNNVTMPAVIVECGFLTNTTEREKLLSKDYQKKIAEAIVEGMLKYLD